MADKHAIVILGGGYAGMYAAMRMASKFRKRIKRGTVSITLLTPESYMTYQPFLPETAAGNLEPRHVVANLRHALPTCAIINGWVTGITANERTVAFTSAAGEDRKLPYDTLIVALGSVSRLLPIPGLAEHGIGIKSVGEAVLIRNQVLRQLDVAASTHDAEVRKRALTFVVVGGGFAGIETLAELEDMTRAAVKDYPNVSRDDLRWILVEATNRILPELATDVGKRTATMLRKRGIELKLDTRLVSAVAGTIELSDGEKFPAETLIWTAGVKANPVLKNTDLPIDKQGRLRADAWLRVIDQPNVWVAGDCAAVPDRARPGEFTPPSAQHAIRQAKHVAANIVTVLKGGHPTEYVHKNLGAVAGLGLYRGAAQVLGIKLGGFPAWIAHRGYHGMMMPTINRKVRVFADWTLALFFRRDVTALSELQNPRAEFERAAGKSPHASHQ